MRLLSTLLLLVGLFVITAIHPTAQTTVPMFTNCTNGGLVWMDQSKLGGSQPSFHCVDPANVGKTGPTFVGVACAPSGAGTVIMAQLPDGKSCLNLVAVPNSLLAQQGQFTGYDQLMLVHVGPAEVVRSVSLAAKQ